MLYIWFGKIRQFVLTKLTIAFYYPLLYLVYKPRHKGFSYDDLAAMPLGSIGNSIINFWIENKLSKIGSYELHDAKHLLLGYGINYEEEIQMQYFELGNGNRSLPVLVVVIFGTLFTFDFIPQYIKAYKRGKACLPITDGFLVENITADLITLKTIIIK